MATSARVTEPASAGASMTGDRGVGWRPHRDWGRPPGQKPAAGMTATRFELSDFFLARKSPPPITSKRRRSGDLDRRRLHDKAFKASPAAALQCVSSGYPPPHGGAGFESRLAPIASWMHSLVASQGARAVPMSSGLSMGAELPIPRIPRVHYHPSYSSSVVARSSTFRDGATPTPAAPPPTHASPSAAPPTRAWRS